MKHLFINPNKGLLFLILCSAIACGCGKKTEGEQQPDESTKGEPTLPNGLSPEEAAKVVAKVGERTITVGDVTQQINRLSPYIRRRWAAPEKRKEFLDKLIRVELLSQEAERLGLGDDAEVERTVNQVMVRLMVKNDLEKELFPTTIDENVLQGEYEKEKDKYFRPAQVRASHIVLKTQADAEKLLKELKENAKDGRLFREKARESSIDKETAERGGDIGYFSRPAERRDDEPEVPKAVAEAVFALNNVGDIADQVIKSDQGFHIVKLTNKRAEMNRSFESVKRMIENRLLRDRRSEAMDKFIEDLRQKAKIEVFDENLAKLELKVDAQRPSPSAPPMVAPPLHTNREVQGKKSPKGTPNAPPDQSK